MTRDDLEATMSFVAERAMEAESVGNRDVAGSMRGKWWALREQYEALDPAHVITALRIANEQMPYVVPVPERAPYEPPAIETSGDAPEEILF